MTVKYEVFISFLLLKNEILLSVKQGRKLHASKILKKKYQYLIIIIFFILLESFHFTWKKLKNYINFFYVKQ